MAGKKSEENLVSITTDSESQRRRAKKSQAPVAKAKRKATKTVKDSLTEPDGTDSKPHTPDHLKPRRILPETQDYLRKTLTEPDKDGHTYLHDFINSFLNEAKHDPSSKAGVMLASSIFTERTLQLLDEEVNKQMNKDVAFQTYRIRQTLYPKQQEVFDDNYDRTILCICSRRVGKSEMDARLLAKRVLRPDQKCVYINRTFDAAVRQLQKPLDTALSAVDMHYEGSLGSGMIKFSNGSSILILGNNNAKDIDKLRGEKIALVCMDECAHMRNVKQIVQEVIEPAMMDYADSQLIFTGTPPRTKHNFMQELYDNPTIRKFHWTYLDNPFLPNRDKVLEEVCRRYGLTADAPFIRREYFGEMGAVDEEAMVFHGWKKTDALPDKTWTHAWIGVDFGFEDKAAVVAVLGDSQTKQCYVVRTWSEAKKGIIELCQTVRNMYDELKSKYRISREPQVVVDTNNKESAFELYNTYKIPNVMTAYKYDKNMAIDQLAEWLRTATIQVVGKNNDELIQDLDNTVWARDEETDELLHELDEDAYHGNASYALLYVSRMIAYDVLGVTTTEVESRVRRIIDNVQE